MSPGGGARDAEAGEAARVRWHAFDLRSGSPQPTADWSDAHQVFVTNRPPLRSQASGFVPRYRGVIADLVGRGPTSLVVVIEQARGIDPSELASRLAAELAGLRFVVIAVLGSPERPWARALHAASAARRGGLRWPVGGPGPDAAVLAAHLPMAPLALASPRGAGAFLLEEGFHRLDVPSDPGARVLGWLADRRAKRVLRRIRRDGRPAIVLTEAEREHFARWLPVERVHVVPLWVDPTGLSELPDGTRAAGSPFVVGCVGRLADRRTADPLAAVIEEAHRSGRSWRWVLVGSNPSPVLRQLAEDHPDLVQVTGRVPDVGPFYGEVDAVLVPAASTTGTKTTLLQPWAAGRPVVASPAAAHSAAAVDGTSVLAFSTPSEAVAQLARLADDPELVRRLVAAGRAETAARDGVAASRRIVDLALGATSTATSDDPA